jgi:rhodanese-related sulfurtransferase
MVAEATAAVPAVKAQDVQQRMQEDSNTLIIDVRDSAQVREASIPGAINIGYGDLLFAADNEVPEEWRDPRLQDRSRPIITHCVLGPLGAIAAKTLQDMGFTNVNYMEGCWVSNRAAQEQLVNCTRVDLRCLRWLYGTEHVRLAQSRTCSKVIYGSL